MAENKLNNNVRFSIGMLSIIILLVIQLVGFAFGYGMLTQQVQFNRQIITQYQQTQSDILSRLDTLNTRLTRIETAVGK